MAKYTENYKLIGSDGRVFHKRIDEFLKTIDDELDRALVKDEIYKRIHDTKQGKLKGSVTTRTLRSITSGYGRTIEKMLINSGFSDQELMRETGLNIDPIAAKQILYDEENWKENGTIFVNPLNGVAYHFTFDYSGNLFTVIL